MSETPNRDPQLLGEILLDFELPTAPVEVTGEEIAQLLHNRDALRTAVELDTDVRREGLATNGDELLEAYARREKKRQEDAPN